jgi:hypothetical protein
MNKRILFTILLTINILFCQAQQNYSYFDKNKITIGGNLGSVRKPGCSN